AKALAARDVAKKDYYFGRHDEHRIELSRGRNLTLTPRQQGVPLNFFVYPYAEVDGKEHDGVTGKFAFRER
ncbi:MAG: transglutaminase domain-containing protein, partial [Actinomycetota bacterium]